MSEAPGGSAGFGHGSDPDEHEALLRRIREFLRHGAAAEAGVEEWGEFAAQLRFLREELPPEERQALLERWDRVLTRALPDLSLNGEQRENVLLALEAAAAEGAAWAALEDRPPPDQGAGVAPVLRPSVWTLDWETPSGTDEDGDHREDEALVLTAADGRAEARFVLADRLVLAHLAADVRGLLAEGQSLPAVPGRRPTDWPAIPSGRRRGGFRLHRVFDPRAARDRHPVVTERPTARVHGARQRPAGGPARTSARTARHQRVKVVGDRW